MRDNRKLLIEKSDIQALRAKYLRLIAEYRSDGRYITYVDETYVHSGHTVSKQWCDASREGFHKEVSKGRRLIIVHGGGCNGFVDNALLIFTSGCKSGDYHDEMNFENFSKWLREQYLPNLPPNSVVVLDNASYHNVQLEKVPNMSSRKAEMLRWLHEHNIEADAKMYKPELYAVIKANKSRHIQYKIDDTVTNAGHTVLRLPPYHPDLNPIEMIWATVKNAIASRNVTGKKESIKDLLHTISKLTEKL